MANMKWNIMIVVLFICMKGCQSALVEMTTNNIYQTYLEMVDNNFDISSVVSFTFEVKVCHDGFVGLAQTYGVRDENFYEVLLGGWDGKRHGIRDGISHDLEISHDDPKFLSCNEFRQFWVSWRSGVIALGRGPTVGVNEIVMWDDPNPHPVNYALISSGFGAVGEWKFYNVDGGWGGWGSWSSCVPQPGGLLIDQRVRECNDPPPELGGGCIGNGTELALEPCHNDFHWYILKKDTKVTLGEHDTFPARSRTDCCRICQQSAACVAVSYDTATSDCLTTTVLPQLVSLNSLSGWETWVRK